jgi:hypothetical protein
VTPDCACKHFPPNGNSNTEVLTLRSKQAPPLLFAPVTALDQVSYWVPLGILNEGSVAVESSHEKWTAANITADTLLLGMDYRLFDDPSAVGLFEVLDSEATACHK